MGLDMAAYTRETEPSSPVDFKAEATDVCIMTWRKHPNLHGWMEQLYRKKGGTAEDFNVTPVLLTAEDIDELEKVVKADALPHTEGFFFGRSRPEDKEDDLVFIARARDAMLNGKFVYYDSWW